MDWSQISVGAIGGGLLTWLGSLFKTWFEYRLEEKKHKAEDDRVVQAEAREQARKEEERLRDEESAIGQHEARLLLLKTRLNGATEISSATNTIDSIHDFFFRCPQYLKIVDNKIFLEKYPLGFKDRVHYDSGSLAPDALDELKRDARKLQVR